MIKKRRNKVDKLDIQKYIVNQITDGLLSNKNIGIVEFVERVCYNNQAKLFLPQKVVLKCLYNESLNKEEIDLLKEWANNGPSGIPKTNWKPGRFYRNLVLCAGRRGSKALCLKTRIPTPQGDKLLQDIHVGDYVFNDKGEPVKVLNESEIFTNNKCYKLHFSDGTTIIADAGHLWRTEACINREKKDTLKNIITTQNIVNTLYINNNENKILNHAIELCNALQYPSQPINVEPYLFGLSLAFNSSNGKFNCSKVEFDKIELELTNRNIDYIIVEATEYSINFKIPSLEKVNINYIPNEYIYNSVSVRKDLLEGLLINTKDSSVYINKDPYILSQVNTILLDLGYYTKYTPYNSIIEIKVNKSKRYIVKADIVPSVPVKCIMVEGEYFLAGDNIITHNSTIASFVVAYEFYKLWNMQNPQLELGVLPNDPIHLFAIATSHTQATETIFGKITGVFKASDYFQSLVQKGEIIIKKTQIDCPSKALYISAKHTNTDALVGYALKCLVLDEVCRFENVENPRTGEINSLAFELWNNVGKATSTFNEEGNHGIKLAISSAWEEGDPMQRFEDMADKSTNILRFNLTSYDLNLKKKKEDHIDEYTINPVQALLEYENVRPGVSGGYFNKDLMETCKRPNYGSVIDTIETENMITVVDKTTNKPKKVFYLINKVTRIEKLTDINAKPAFLHVDFSKRRDATAMGLVRPVYVQLDDEESPNWKIQLEALLKWQPFVGGDGYRREVSYEDVESLIDVFIDNRKVKYLSFDIYNNSATLQKYQNKGIICTEASVTVKSQLKFFTLLKELFVENRLILGKDNVNYSLVVEQLAGLVIHPQTGKITHGVLGKDLSDALANAVYQCYEWMVMKRLINKKAIHKGPAVISSGPGNISKVRSGVNNLNKVKAVTDLNKILKKLR